MLRSGPGGAGEGAGEGVLSGVVERVVFRNAESGYTVLRLRREGAPGPIVVGAMPPVHAGAVVRAEGVWRVDPTWGRQFAAAVVDVLPPSTSEGLASYLASGIVPGLGARLAKRLAKHFDDRLAFVIEREPLRLREVPGVGPKLAQRIADAWREHRATREIMLFLQSNGISPTRARPILAAYGAGAVDRITADPYALARDIRGIGFATADALALRLGFAPDAPVRLVAGLEQALRESAEQGHTGLRRRELVERARWLVDVPGERLEGALARAVAEGHLRETAAASEAIVQLALLAEAEEAVARRLRVLTEGRPPWRIDDLEAAMARAEAALGVSLPDDQRRALRRVLAAKVVVVTGGPGTGKTTLVRALLAALPERDLAVALAAPTGRAAKRLAERTGREARTLHRLLEADPARGFRRDASWPLELDLLVVDEASMVDTLLMRALLEALPDEAALVLVGDADQLPSVGPGQVLADVIASGAVPVARLTEIFRQAARSGIVANAHRINRGELPIFPPGEEPGGDFFGVRATSAEDAAAKVVELAAERIPARFGLDPLSEVQVLCPTNRGALGTLELNHLLQERLNPTPAAALERGGGVLAVGDKVMQIENDYERDVYNGDLGRVTAVDPAKRSLTATFEGRELTYAGEDLERLALAYAVTVHKAQGSEYPAVVLVLMRQHRRMLRRRLLYTAVTRARRLVVLVCEPEALERAVRDVGEQPRLTMLRRRLDGTG